MLEKKGHSGLDKRRIIRNKKEIIDLLAKGTRFSCNEFVIIYKPDSEPKVGFFASGKIRSAVKRNRVKRILREAYRMNKEIFEGLKVIFYAHNLLDAENVLNGFASFRKERSNG
ncbi:MAG: ribonuclease P protein component [bacterium]